MKEKQKNILYQQNKSHFEQKNHNKQCIFITAGGTGGHIFPAEAVAEALAQQHKKEYRVIFITDKRGYEFLSKSNKKTDYKLITINAQNFSGNLENKILALANLTISFFQSIKYIFKYKPKIILSFGGYTTFAPTIAGYCLGAKIILQEQNAVLGLVNRALLPFASKILVSFDNIKFLNKKLYKRKIVHTGNPLRQQIIDSYKKAKQSRFKYQNNSDKITLLITGGSQGASQFNSFAKIISQLRADIQSKLMIYHQVPKINQQQVERHYANSQVHKYIIKEFFTNIGEIISKADLVIGRAGALTISEIQYFAKAAILIPLAQAKNNHQYYNAIQIQNNHTAMIINQKNEEEILKDFEKKLQLILYDNQLELLSNNAKKIYGPKTINPTAKILEIINKEMPYYNKIKQHHKS